MSGHSKWASIKHKKAVVDARRGQHFTKLARAITVAAREGGGDPTGNPSLALAVQKARDASMPKDNIERAIAKGTGEGVDADQIESVLYEGYGPGGVALLIEALTDNRNRTGAEVRHLLGKHGRLATLTTVAPVSRYGILEIGDDGRVANFQEKPRIEGWASAGFFVFNRRIFDYLDGDDCVLEREPLERLAAAGQLRAFRHRGFWECMDTHKDWITLNELWSSGRAPWVFDPAG